MKLRVAFAALSAIATLSAVASAQQPWIKDRRYGEGIGFRTGNLELHPGIAGEFGYDSNYFQRAQGEFGGVTPYWRLRVTPHLTLSTLSKQRRMEEGLGTEPPVVNFRAGLYGIYNESFNADSSAPKADNGSGQRYFAYGAQFSLDVMPERPVGMDLYGDLVRTVEPSNSPEDNVAFNRYTARGGAGVTWRPGGGLFSWRGGYEINYNHFERDAFRTYDNARHYIKTRAQWRLFPRTALISDAEYGIIRFKESGTTTQNDGETLQARFGLNGLVTNHFGVMALGGWAATFYETSESGVRAKNYDGPVGQAELRWFPQPAPSLEATSAAVGLSSVALGFSRNVMPSYLGSFYVRNRGYVNVSYFIGGVFLLGAEAGYSIVQFPESFFANGDQRAPTFEERRIDTQFFAEYRLTDSVALNTTIRYDQNMADVKPKLSPGPASAANPNQDDLDFKRFQAYLGLRLFY